jgi:hypothetical protein
LRALSLPPGWGPVRPGLSDLGQPVDRAIEPVEAHDESAELGPSSSRTLVQVQEFVTTHSPSVSGCAFVDERLW